ncbi:helix-turn-helix domain-containing protein [Thioclava electrotropha]|uniref:Helix-turn-helix domain-containing protein n=1 Tax=Thioclava electrotropha TaxID=1549850 RepID=A0ABX6Z0K7_9RHOB|nr:helix-turn-helix domain-containing protein [Thioclava electrotropha]QPZ93392.1 helix-turn-helix domain-containing protein [Thioclava electrotropha]
MPTGHENPDCDSPPVLLDRAFLRRRWRFSASDTFLWRHEQRGLLVPVTDGTKLRYTWDAVFAFEGGPPPEGMVAAYKGDLLTVEEAARLCSVSPSYIRAEARAENLPSRRAGRACLFVPAEVEAWRARRFVNRKTLKKAGISSDKWNGG